MREALSSQIRRQKRGGSNVRSSSQYINSNSGCGGLRARCAQCSAPAAVEEMRSQRISTTASSKSQILSKKIALLNSWKQNIPLATMLRRGLQFFLAPDNGCQSTGQCWTLAAKHWLPRATTSRSYLDYVTASRLAKPTPNINLFRKAGNGLVSNPIPFSPLTKARRTSEAIGRSADRTEAMAQTASGLDGLQRKPIRCYREHFAKAGAKS